MQGEVLTERDTQQVNQYPGSKINKTQKIPDGSRSKNKQRDQSRTKEYVFIVA